MFKIGDVVTRRIDKVSGSNLPYAKHGYKCVIIQMSNMGTRLKFKGEEEDELPGWVAHNYELISKRKYNLPDWF